LKKKIETNKQTNKYEKIIEKEWKQMKQGKENTIKLKKKKK
jgi:hypothetical protein